MTEVNTSHGPERRERFSRSFQDTVLRYGQKTPGEGL